MNNHLILIIIIIWFLLYYNKKIIDKYTIIERPEKDIFEGWRDLPYIGNKDIITYNKINTENYSRKNLPVYYPISSPLEDNYFNNINSITSPKLSLFRNVLRQVYLLTNQNIQPIVFNNVNRPIEQKQIDKKRIETLSSMIISLINKFGDPILSVKQLKTLNEIHEETEEQSRINFDIKLELNYADSENLGKQIKPDILYIQAEYVFEKTNKLINEIQFFDKKHNLSNSKIDFKAFLASLIVIGAEHNGFIGGRYKENKLHTNRN